MCPIQYPTAYAVSSEEGVFVIRAPIIVGSLTIVYNMSTVARRRKIMAATFFIR